MLPPALSRFQLVIHLAIHVGWWENWSMNAKDDGVRKSVRVNVRLSEGDARVLAGVDKNMSKAVRKLISWYAEVAKDRE